MPTIERNTAVRTSPDAGAGEPTPLVLYRGKAGGIGLDVALLASRLGRKDPAAYDAFRRSEVVMQAGALIKSARHQATISQRDLAKTGVIDAGTLVSVEGMQASASKKYVKLDGPGVAKIDAALRICGFSLVIAMVPVTKEV